MTRPEIEPRSPGPLANTLTIMQMFANGLGDLGSIPGHVIANTLKMVIDTTLLTTQHYKVRIGVVAIEKGAFWSPSTTVANFTFFYMRSYLVS